MMNTSNKEGINFFLRGSTFLFISSAALSSLDFPTGKGSFA